mgnify:CR=1 FL=1
MPKPLLRLERHDRLQLELKVEQPSPGIHARKAEYELDLWFWLPQATGIGRSDYPPNLFYEDLRVHTRLKTPDVTLAQLVRADGEGSPLAVLNTVLGRADDDGLMAADHPLVEAEPKLLCAILKSRLRDGFAGMTDERVVRRAQQLDRDLRLLQRNWRSTKDRLLAFDLPRDLRWSLFFCDESLSIQIEQAVLRILLLLKGRSDVPEGLQAALRQVAVGERHHRDEQGWRTVLKKEGSAREDEGVLDQGRLLKKYWSSVLHLVTRQSAWDGFARHGALGVAAGMAMVWAVAAQVFMLAALGLQLEKGVGVSFLITFTGLATGAYVLKDRIKAGVAAALSRRLPEWIDDRRMLLQIDDDASPLGSTSERVGFEVGADVPDSVQALRINSLRNELLIDTRHEVLHYRRTVEQRPRQAVRLFPRFDGLTEVLRLNVWRWVRTYATPKRMLELLDEDGRVRSKRVDNRYFVDVVVRFRRLAPEPMEILQHKLLVLDRRGIVRVESADEAPATPATTTP